MITHFSPVRFGSGDPSKANMPGLASDRTQITSRKIAENKNLRQDIFEHGGPIEDGKTQPGKIYSPQISQTLRHIIEDNKKKK
jgi:hypothetical protein